MITIYSGCMGSGKTESLIKKYNEIKQDKKRNCLMVKNLLDRTKIYVQSRSGLKAIANLVLKHDEISVLYTEIQNKNITDVFIDEVQFFDYDIVYLVQNNRHVNFYLSGLETDFKKAPFGFLNVIRNQCKNEYIWHDMNCQNCGYISAQWNYRKVKSDSIILVGDNEYMSVCSPCYDLLEGK